MTSEQALIRDVSDTALWVAAYRAEESARADALFVDPFAEVLAGARGMEIASRVKQPAVRFGVVLRTAILDREIEQTVHKHGFDAVLNLAAGLDTRPYRLSLPADVSWVEVDLPEIIAYKEAILTDATPICRIERIGLDLTDHLARQDLFARISSSSHHVLVVTEGLLGYLAPTQVASLARDLRTHANFTEWLTDISTASANSSIRSAGDELKGGQAPILFSPAESTAFFEPAGWIEADFFDYFQEAPRLGRDSMAGMIVRTCIRLLPSRKRDSLRRFAGVARLEHRHS